MTKLYHHARFETQSDWLAHLRALDGMPCVAYDDPRRDRSSDWAGGTFENARTLAESGWPEGAAKMADAAGAAVQMAQSVGRPTLAYDVAGAYPDVPLAVAGDPMCMVALGDEQIQTRPIVRLYVEMSASGSVSAESIQNFGAAILAQIDALESADVRTEVNLCFGVLAGGKVHQISIVAKQAADPIDFERMAFLMVHPSQLRRLVFDVLTRDPKFVLSGETSGFGKPHRIIVDDDPEGIIVPSVNEHTHHYRDIPSSVARIQSVLEEGLTRIGHPMRFDAR